MKTLTLILGKPFENVRFMFGEIQKFAECPPLGTIVFLKTFSITTSDILKTSGNPCRQVLELYAQVSLISHFIIEVFPLYNSVATTCVLLTDIISNCVLIEPLSSSKCYLVKLPNHYEHQ